MTDRERALAKYRDRMVAIEQERRDRSDDLREIAVEMKSAGLTKAEVAGVKLAVRRHFEDEQKRAARESAEEIAEALGALADTPLGEAAVDDANKDLARRIKREMARGDATVRSAVGALDRLAREDGCAAVLQDGAGETVAVFGA